MADWRDLVDKAGLSPLDALMLFIGGKQQPPWELLDALHADYERYFKAAGRITLEEALLHEKPRKGQGNAAQLVFKKMSKMHAVAAYATLVRNGMKPRLAAERVTKKYHPIDPDSFMREIRAIEKQLRDKTRCR